MSKDLKPKAGQILLEHDAQRLDMEDDVSEYRKSMEPEILASIQSIIKKSKEEEIYKHKDFYIIFAFTNDRVLRQPKPIIWARRSCPTPVYKQSVFKYWHLSGTLEFLWTLPDAILYYHILRNSNQFMEDKETEDIARFVHLNETGELLEWVKKENGEKKDAVIILN